MEIKSIHRILLIGNGSMCQQIAVQCALFACDAVLYVRNIAKNDQVRQEIESILAGLEKQKMVSRGKAAKALSRISLSNDVADACQHVALISESVAEDLAVKRETWGKFAPHLPKNAILTTNTSSLLPSQFAAASGAPERFLAWHFHLPVFRQNLCDIMVHPGTDPKYVPVLEAFSKKIHQNCCILKKEHGGFLANNMLFVVLDKALDLYLDDIADFANIDKAWMGVRVADSGPFGIMDKIGLDVMLELLPVSPNRAAKERLLRDMTDQGRLGVKSGKGFYDYPDPEYQVEGFVFRATAVA